MHTAGRLTQSGMEGRADEEGGGREHPAAATGTVSLRQGALQPLPARKLAHARHSVVRNSPNWKPPNVHQPRNRRYVHVMEHFSAIKRNGVHSFMLQQYAKWRKSDTYIV